jgi:hypothetical protein
MNSETLNELLVDEVKELVLFGMLLLGWQVRALKNGQARRGLHENRLYRTTLFPDKYRFLVVGGDGAVASVTNLMQAEAVFVLDDAVAPPHMIGSEQQSPGTSSVGAPHRLQTTANGSPLDASSTRSHFPRVAFSPFQRSAYSIGRQLSE